MSNGEFKQLIKEGIDSIANRQSKKVRVIEEEIGEALHVSHHTVQRWKRGHAPNDMERLEFLVSYCSTYGRVDRAWAQRFLMQARHPAPEAVIQRVFPEPSDEFKVRDLPRVQHNLPPRYGEFIGREAEVSRVLEWVESSRWPLASVEGMGGIGKTSLAVEVAHRCLPGEQLAIAQPFEAVVWTSARDMPDFDLHLEHVLDAIAHVLDYNYLIQLPPDQKLKSVDKLLRSCRTLVIVDNFESITDVTLVKFLEQMPEPSLGLITSRYKQLRRVWDIPLYGLKDDEILALIRRHAHRIGLTMLERADDDTLARLAAATGNNPKAVELALGIIKQKALPFNTVIDELFQASQVVEEVFDYIFLEAWELLSEKTRRVMLALPLFVPSAGRQALSAISEVADFELHKAIEQLVGMSLLEASEALDLNQQRYTMHPLTEAFARSQLSEDQREHSTYADRQRKFYHYFAEWSLDTAGSNFWDYVSWGQTKYERICQELQNLLLSLEWAHEQKDWEAVLELSKVIVHPIYYQGQLNKRLTCSEYGLAAAKILGRVEDEIWFSIQGLGSIYLLRGDYDLTRKHVKHGIWLARSHNYPDAIAMGETYLSYLDLQTGNTESAQKRVKRALEHAESPLFRYRAHHAAGHIHRHLENYEEARDYYFKSSELIVESNYIDTSDVWLGFTKLGQKKLSKAAHYFRRYLSNHQHYGNQRVMGMAKLGLARYHEAVDELDQARHLAQEAHDILFALNAHWELKQVSELLKRLSA